MLVLMLTNGIEAHAPATRDCAPSFEIEHHSVVRSILCSLPLVSELDDELAARTHMKLLLQ